MALLGKKRLIVILLFFFGMIGPSVYAMDFLYFYDPGFLAYGKAEYPKTLFSHDLHYTAYQIDCQSCHHIYASGKNIWQEDMHTQMCSDCHGDSKAELVNAHHMNCWGCHKKIQQEYSKADAPTSDCKGCHVPLNDLDGEQARILEKTKNIDKTLLNVLKTINKKAFY